MRISRRAFLDRFTARVKALKVGDPLLPETEVGPLILPREADRVVGLDRRGRYGRRRAHRRRTRRTARRWFHPSSSTRQRRQSLDPRSVRPDNLRLSLLHLDEAIAAANSLPVAFQASIFTEDLRTAFDAAERLAASAVMVNDHTAFRTDWMPFAGRRQSGYGVGGIPWTMQEMTEQKMIVFRI